MDIKINYENIKTLEQALSVIQKLVRGLNNCYQSGFNICPKCGEITTENYICWNCSYDFNDEV